ncbi:MAG: 50S ribosomal protein L24 [Phycisphaerae bacterium]|jgi:large subunit ribosomal protein L24|nr:50S ribosomal protein L24 [Phycisphaerae bacterium]MBT6270422.1 50S ribosomal protein L24 [Phycisphaerae bacterium]MBT6282784.1 50S ribosomal protein L24 [Phycisphaerae bacterium]
MPRHIRTGDTVMVTAGNDKGAVGEILRVLIKKDRVVVKGVNVRSKNIKPSQTNPNGGVIKQEMPIHMSNVSPVVEGKPARLRFETQKDGAKVRIGVVRDNSGKKIEKVISSVHSADARSTGK